MKQTLTLIVLKLFNLTFQSKRCNYPGASIWIFHLIESTPPTLFSPYHPHYWELSALFQECSGVTQEWTKVTSKEATYLPYSTQLWSQSLLRQLLSSGAWIMKGKARVKYEKMSKKHHPSLKVETTGLHVDSSPDGLIHCSSCRKGMLEIKCPYGVHYTQLHSALHLRNERGYKLSWEHDNCF